MSDSTPARPAGDDIHPAGQDKPAEPPSAGPGRRVGRIADDGSIIEDAEVPPLDLIPESTEGKTVAGDRPDDEQPAAGDGEDTDLFPEADDWEQYGRPGDRPAAPEPP